MATPLHRYGHVEDQQPRSNQLFVRRKQHPGSKAANARPERPRTALATMRTGKEREPEFQHDSNTVQVNDE